MKHLILLFCVYAVTGCGHGWYWRSPITDEPPIVIHPIEGSDIIAVPAGAKIEWDDMADGTPGDLFFTEKAGYFVSDFYMNEVMDAQVAEK